MLPFGTLSRGDIGSEGHYWIVRTVVDAQNALTESVFAQCDTRDRFKALMTQMYDYPRFGCAGHP